MKGTSPVILALCVLLAAALSPRPSRSARGAAGAGASRSLCPVITVECPTGPVTPGTFVNFKVKVSGAGPESFEAEGSGALSYRWAVSAGTITSGAEGSVNTGKGKAEFAAVVDTTGLPNNASVTATVEVGGLVRSCSNTNSCTTAVLSPPEPHPIDYYGNIRYADEQARLDNFAIELQNSPDLHGYIECYGGRVGRHGEARARCERAKRYLTGRRAIAPDRIVLVDGGYRNELTVGLWLLPPGTDFQPAPTVDPKDVRFTDAVNKVSRKKPSAGASASRRRVEKYED